MIPAPFKVVLDACVLYPFTVRDVLLEAAAQGFYQVYWSETILHEALRNLISDGRMTERETAAGASSRPGQSGLLIRNCSSLPSSVSYTVIDIAWPPYFAL